MNRNRQPVCNFREIVSHLIYENTYMTKDSLDRNQLPSLGHFRRAHPGVSCEDVREKRCGNELKSTSGVSEYDNWLSDGKSLARRNCFKD